MYLEREVRHALAPSECVHQDLRDEEPDGDPDRDLNHTNAECEGACIPIGGGAVVLNEPTPTSDSGLYAGRGKNRSASVHIACGRGPRGGERGEGRDM